MKIGIVGCGKFASKRIIPAIEKVPGCTLHGIQSRSKQLDVPIVTTSPEELIFHPDIEAIIICSPHHLHKSQLAHCAERNIPVLCEKPLAVSYDEYLEIIDFFPEKTPLLVGQCYRFKDSIRQAKEWVQRERIGELLSLDFTMHIPIPPDNWRYDPNQGGGVLLDIGIHIIDTIHFLTGSTFSEPHIVHRRDAVDTTVDLLGVLDCGARVSFSISFEYPYETGFIITGTKGRLKGSYIFRQMDDNKESLLFTSGDDTEIFVPIQRDNIYEKEISHFIHAIYGQEPPIIDARDMEENYRVLQYIQQEINLSSQKNLAPL